MPLPQNLNTNEVKNAAGTEVEFLYRDEVGRTREYAASGEAPNLPHRIRVKHAETGKGIELVRRSVAQVEKQVLGVSGTKRAILVYKVAVVPVGDIADLSAVKDASAELDAFCATTGAATAVLFDGSGYGDSAIINGTL
jgi:hypothetical protein